MRKATRSVVALLGVTAGIGGLEHGYFEILQGNSRPQSLIIASIGPPCIADEAWNACEPAMTIIPNFLVTGILAVVVSLLILVWSAAFAQRESGGWVLIGLSLALLLFGGGFFPPLIGITGGAVGTRINKPLEGRGSGGFLRLGAALWPWPLVIFLVWVFGQILVGYFFNDLLQSIMIFGVLLILLMLVLSICSAYARDVQTATQAG